MYLTLTTTENMRILLISYIMAIWGCNTSPSKIVSGDSTYVSDTLEGKETVEVGNLTAKTKDDNLSTKYPPYKEFKLFRGDTLGYLQYNFVGRKAYYKHKPLTVLFNDIEVAVLKFVIITPSSPKP